MCCYQVMRSNKFGTQSDRDFYKIFMESGEYLDINFDVETLSYLDDNFQISVYDQYGSILNQFASKSKDHLSSFDDKVIFDFSKLPITDARVRR